jgi:exopolysaccharide biosynthesis protein
MRLRFIKTAVSVLVIVSILATTMIFAAAEVVYTNSISLADNLEFITSVSSVEGIGRNESFEIKMTGSGDARPIVMFGERIFGTTTISSVICQAEELGKNVLAAVNADFFSVQTGVPDGLVIKNGVFKSSSTGHNAVSFGFDGSVHFSVAPTIEMTLHNHGSEHSNNEGQVVRPHHFNKFRADTGGMYLFSDSFSSVNTRTSTPGWFVRFRILEGTPTVWGTMSLQVTETLTYDCSIPIGEGYLILTAADEGGWGEKFTKFAVGDFVTLTTTPSDPELINARHATGGGVMIVSDGEITPEATTGLLMTVRHPRTAFGVTADGRVISYVVDGRNSPYSVGKTGEELANEMIRLGAVHAINFDGGGSSALSVRLPGEESALVVNRPSDSRERGTSTFLLFVTDAVSDGNARHLALRNDGQVLLPYSSIDLDIVATDRGYMPTELPADVRAEPTSEDASVTELRFTAGSDAGREIISLHSQSTGAFGSGSVFVIPEPTSMMVTRLGATTPLRSVVLEPGEILELDITSIFHRLPVISQPISYTFEVTGDIGHFEEPGVFVAGDENMQIGVITVSIGELSAEINVRVGGFEDMRDHWANRYSEFLFERGITIGVTPTHFGPEQLMIRADFVLMLYRAAGMPDVWDSENFYDVTYEDYFAQALAWARVTGVVDIPENNLFEPTTPITREQAFIFTYRTLDILSIPHTSGEAEDLERFPDADSVPENAIVPTATLVRLGVVEGSDGMLLPNQTITRAEMAKVLTVTLELAT